MALSSNFELRNFVRSLDQFGVTDVLLPFLLVFVFIFAILQKTKILGEGKKNLSVAVAVIVGLLFVVPHVTGKYPANSDPVEIINNALPQVSIIIIAIVFLLILIGVFGQDFVFLGASMPGMIAVASMIIILIIFGGAAGWWQGPLALAMATFLDITGLEHFSSLFVFLFSWALIYAVFMLTKIFGDNKVLPALVAFLVSIFVLLSPGAVSIIREISPWIAIMLILIIIVIGVVVKIRARVEGPGEGSNEDGSDYSKTSNVLLNPKMLGMILLLAIGVF